LTFSDLPQVCQDCRKLKESKLGQFKKVKSKYSKRIWICFSCLETRVPFKKTSRPEREVIRVLIDLKLYFIHKYDKLKPFVFNFALPKLMLILELETGLPKNDRKIKTARRYGWEVVTLKNLKRPELEICRAVMERESNF